MKTTIELPDALVAQARRVARERHSTLRALVEAGLRTEIDNQLSSAPKRTFRFPTAAGDGLRGGVDPRDLREHAYGLPADET